MMRTGVMLGAWLLAAEALAQPAERAPAQEDQPPTAGNEAVIGVLNKRLGTTRDFRLKPGQRFSFGTIRGVMHACERTAPWETRQEEGAFVQIVEQPVAVARTESPPAPRTIFSGWLFARSPSLNPLRHPLYDVWLKSCTMDVPDGPDSSARSANRTSGGSTPGTSPSRARSAGG